MNTKNQKEELLKKLSELGLSEAELNDVVTGGGDIKSALSRVNLTNTITAKPKISDKNKQKELEESYKNSTKQIQQQQLFFTKSKHMRSSKGINSRLKLKKFQRRDQLPVNINSNDEMQKIENYNKMKQLNKYINNLQKTTKTQVDEVFTFPRDTDTGNALKTVQSSIANYRQQKQRFNVVKQFKRGGVPSSALAPIPI